jgi:hypothetical protein
MLPQLIQVTRYTSALTLQVLGNAKGVFTTALSIFIFRNPYTVTSVGGYLITVAVRLPQGRSSSCCVIQAPAGWAIRSCHTYSDDTLHDCRAWAVMQRPNGISLHRRPAWRALETRRGMQVPACPAFLYLCVKQDSHLEQQSK